MSKLLKILTAIVLSYHLISATVAVSAQTITDESLGISGLTGETTWDDLTSGTAIHEYTPEEIDRCGGSRVVITGEDRWGMPTMISCKTWLDQQDECKPIEPRVVWEQVGDNKFARWYFTKEPITRGTIKKIERVTGTTLALRENQHRVKVRISERLFDWTDDCIHTKIMAILNDDGPCCPCGNNPIFEFGTLNNYGVFDADDGH